MRQPEMSYSPAYYQDPDHLLHRVPAPAPAPAPAPPAAAHLPSDSSSFHHPSDNQHGSAQSQSQYPNGHSSSDPWDASDPAAHHHHPYYPSYPRQGPVEAAGYPNYEQQQQPAAAPVTFVSSPSRNDGSLLTRPSFSSSTAVRKEDRVRGSWTDHSSYMSGDNHHHNNHPHLHRHRHGASRASTSKRAIQTEDPLADDNQDALLMLFRLSLPVPVFSFVATLYTLFGLLFVVLVSPLRLCSCIPYLRSTSFRGQLCDLLVPQLHIHERLVRMQGSSQRSSSTQEIYIDPDRSSDPDSNDYSVGGLIAVLLLSSFLSLAFLLLVWTAAAFWIFAMVMGNPDGTEKKDDGRAAVLGVCRWWQIWLRKARRRPS